MDKFYFLYKWHIGSNLFQVDLDPLVTLCGIGILEYFQQDGFFA